MSNRLFVAEQWDQFCRAAIPADAPLDQRREMRCAFYAGAKALLYLLLHEVSQTEEMTPSDISLMMSIDQELLNFAALVKAGRA